MANPLHDNPRSKEIAGESDEDPRDFSKKYNTKLSKEDESKYQEFVTKRKKESGKDLAKDEYDYDVRGWWKGGADTADNGHGPDTHKKPNHPTFSDESVYHGKDGNEGGKWGEKDGKTTFKPGKTNKQHRSPEELQEYFNEREPDAQLVGDE